jgi:MFS family permease
MFSLLRRNGDVRNLFIAQVVSYLGDWFTFVALAGLVEDLTGSKFLVSLVLVSLTLPSFLLSPVAGAAADRFDRKTILVLVSLGQGVAALALLLTDSVGVWIAFLAQCIISGLAAFVRPATEAAVPNLVDNEDDLRLANSLFGSTWGVMLAVGAALGGVYADIFGRTASFVTDAITFFVAAGAVALVHGKMQEERTAEQASRRMRPMRDMKEAVQLAREDKVIFALMCSKLTFAVGAGIVSQIPVLASSAFDAGDTGRGMLFGARGIGSGLGPIIAARMAGGDMRRILHICGISGLVFSICYVGAAVSPSIIIAGIAVALAHLGGGAQWTLSTYGLQMESPDALRGRVMAGDFALVTLMLSVTSVLAGITSDAIGVRPTIAIFAAAAAAASITYLMFTRTLRANLRPSMRS